ncbi:unnamed protein product [Clonostachys rosea]|uniref:Serine peptidase n=1 Tax=Bionectria ochroleuca TaxID=29856 RepID=A0ABY6UQU1_BIOOC|nr:unnamed protein product [Clonostachys rosea]
MKAALSSAVPWLLLPNLASAGFFPRPVMDLGPPNEENSLMDVDITATNGWGTFDQLIDHSNASLGTFKQRYWYGTQYWKGPGSPIIYFNPGEQSATNFNNTFMTNTRLTGLFAEAVGGAVVMTEHRYWGESSPYDTLTIDALQYLTVENSIKDNIYFAKNWVPPFDDSGESAPDKAPWVFSGGSYTGAMAHWMLHTEPGTFWAYHSTSGTLEAIRDFWQYFRPVQEATPANCSKDLNAAMVYIDNLLLNGTEEEKFELKDKFMLGDQEDGDFASWLEVGPWTWQSTQFYTESVKGYNDYYRFCDYIENVWPGSENEVPGPEGVGKDKAIDGYAKWMTEQYMAGLCEASGYPEWQGTYNTACFALSNASSPMYTDLAVDNFAGRQWDWMLCNEPLLYWQTGAPKSEPKTLVPRTASADYWENVMCNLVFPEGRFGLSNGKTVEDYNNYTSGWTGEYGKDARIMDANGQFDPWRDATLSSVDRPGGPMQSTPEHPIRVIPGAMHCSEYYKNNWDVNEETKNIAYEEVETLKQWIDEFYEAKQKA